MANTIPIYPGAIRFGFGKVSTADATALKNHDGTTANAVLLFTAGATSGSRIDEIKAQPLGTNVASVLRIFINNGQDQTVAANNALYAEVSAPAVTISETAALAAIPIVQLGNSALQLPAGYKIYAVVGTTIAAGIEVTVVGGDY